MIRGAIAALLALALAACGGSESRDELPPPSPALWTITTAEGERGWLFGTIHSLPDGAEWRTPEIEQAIAQADLLVVEVAELDDRAKLSAVFERLSRTSGLPPLAGRVAPRSRDELRALLSQGGYREGDFAAVETWAAALMLARLSESGGNGVDRALVREFGGRPIEELEGIEGQLGVFDRLPEQDQRDLLEAVVEETANEAGRGRLARLWLAGDIEAIAAEGEAGMLRDPELRAALLTGRNRVWADRIAALLASGKRPLIAVGAAHLAPPEGLPELLAAKGYRIERVH